MLSSLINYTGRRKVAIAFKLRNSSANRVDRDNPPSPKSFVSPELVDISTDTSPNRPPYHPSHSSENIHQFETPISTEPADSDDFEEPEETEDSEDAIIAQRTPLISPRVQLEIDTGPDEWFPSDLLNSEAFTFSATQQPPANLVHSREIGADTSPSATLLMNENSHKSGIPPNDTSVAESASPDEDLLPPSSFRKPSPTAIEIPDAHEFQLPLTRSSTRASQADSVLSSSVSGTTLARALIGNSFVLSTDHRWSKHRTGLARQDSTTLPRNSFLHSPYWRDKRISGGEIVSFPNSSSIPPVPPVPMSLVPNRRKRTSSAPDKSLVALELERQPSLNSLADSRRSHSPDTSQQEIVGNQLDHRNSHPSNVSSSSPSVHSAPDTPPVLPGAQPPGGSSTHSLAASTVTAKTSSSKGSSTQPSTHRPSISTHHRTWSEPSVTPLSSVPTSGFGSALADYEFATPVKSPLSLSNSGESPDKNESKKRQKSGQGVISPTTPRVDWILPTPGSAALSPQSRTASHLPIGERPRSFLQSQAPGRSSETASPPSFKRAGQPINLLSPSRGSAGRQGVFNRQRSGSTPNPIMVTRDSRDFNTYNITVATAADSTPTSPEYTASQTFPETPNAFSPMWSASSFTSPLRLDGSDILTLGSSGEISRSVTFSGGPSASNLTQQVFLTRAATTMRGTRAGVSRPRLVPPPPFARNMSVLLTPPPEEPPDEDISILPKREVTDGHVDPAPLAPSLSHGELSVNEKTPAHNGLPTPHSKRSSNPSEVSLESVVTSPSPSRSSTGDASNQHTPSISRNSPSMDGRTVQGNMSTDTLSLESSSRSLNKPLPAPPLSPHRRSSDGQPPEDSSLIGQSHLNAPSAIGVLQDTTVAPALLSTLPQSSQASSPQQSTIPIPRALPSAPRIVSPPPPITVPHEPVPPTRPPRRFPTTPQTPPDLVTQHPNNSLTLSLGAPPPYYSIISENSGSELKANSTGSHSDSSSHAASSSYSASPPANTSHSGVSVVTPDSSSRSHRAGRRPIGPREPVRNPGSVSTAPVGIWDRNASISSSSNGSIRSRARAFSNASSSVPKFQTPPVRWRGFTMDAAKWTFTSAQLQGIVSRAIRQSSEASSIRLLRLETLDNDLPDEMHRLDMLGTDAKSRYKSLSRKRWGLLASLSAHFEGTEAMDPSDAARILDELADTSATLDQLAEELHTVDEQIAQLKSLRDIHSASALAMALRKLNSSFLKQLAETQTLRAQVEALEAERDLAWKQAQDAANDLDDLTDNLKGVDSHSGQSTPVSARGSSRRSSHVMAVRKSTLRASKAGLHPSRSQRSSVSSTHRNSVASSSAARSTFYSDIIPPVPPIPLPRPLGIVTSDLQSRVSTGISTGSPTSEMKAMVKAQDELYAMLGITPLESGTMPRRPRSLSGTGEAESSPMTSQFSRPLSESSSRCPRGERRSSFPGSIGMGSLLPDDRQAMLATLNLMSG